jgi:hypothetical protein
MSPEMTKADLAEENNALKQDIVNMSAERAELEEALQSLASRIEGMERAMDARASRGEELDIAPEVYYDPFDEQNPHVILNHPEGFVLSWKNPNLRAKKGWKGWVPITYDDEIGKNLGQYLQDPPPRMEGTAQLDSYVRRGTDSILCKLPKEMWDARQQRRSDRSKWKMQAATARDNPRGDGFEYYGEGVRRQQSADNTPHMSDARGDAISRRTPMMRKDD